MKWSFSIMRVSGIDVRIHVTFFLLLAFFGFVSYQDGGLPAAWSGVSFILLLFFCVLLHEFGHAFAARIYGIRTPDITLLPIGGVARLERMPRTPSAELVVAIAGPLVNVFIAVGLFVILGRFVDFEDMLTVDQVGPGQLLTKLMVVNVWLVVFNMIPAFPMDGGRILRAVLAMRLSHDRATGVAALVGQGFAVIFALFGFFTGNIFLLLIAVFVFMGARQEALVSKIHSAAAPDSPVSRAMITQFLTLPVNAPRWQARELAQQSMQTVFPVVDESRRAVGWLEREELLKPSAPAADMLTIEASIQPALILAADDPFESAIERMQQTGAGLAMVTNASGQLVGIISLASLLERAKFRK
jgi:Zn-dependent protease/CBS domain-containing protein